MWSRIRAILFENLGLKFASLVLALLLYGHVLTDQEREETISVPVRLAGLADSLATSGEAPQQVNARVRGKWRDLIRLSLSHPSLPLDLAAVESGQFRAMITAEDVQRRAVPPELSKAVTVNEVLDPRSVDVRVEPRVARRVRVVPRIVGEPGDGYRIAGTPEAEPDSVRVTGAESVVAGIDSLSTLAVDITGERAKIQRQVDVVVEPGGITIEPARCLVIVPLERRGSTDAGRP
ncbi:MAG TPA: YbbR-like domain-containing protein [Candidatus Eisenbacteria bacterium]